MKKQICKFIILFFALIHVLNALFLVKTSIIYSAIWLLFAIIEVAVVIVSTRISKQKKRLGQVIACSLAIFLIIQSLLSSIIMIRSISSSTANADYLLVLGYQLDDDQMSKTLIYRVERAYEYASRYPDCKIIVSGGITGKNTVSEASLMKDALVAYGINEERIIVEDKSTSTVENLEYCKSLLQEGEKIVCISSNYHCSRIKVIASNVGIDLKTIGAKAPINLLMNQLMIEKIATIGVLLS